MRTLFFCILMIFISIPIYSASSYPAPKLPRQDSMIKVLRLTNLKNQQTHFFIQNTKITYWHTEGLQNIRHTGTLEGFSGDSLIIEGSAKALSSITRIKKADKLGAAIFKVLFGMGFIQLGILGIIGGPVIFAQNLWDTGETVGLGLGAIILGVIFFLIGRGLLKRPGKINKKYKADIVEISTDSQDFK